LGRLAVYGDDAITCADARARCRLVGMRRDDREPFGADLDLRADAAELALGVLAEMHEPARIHDLRVGIVKMIDHAIDAGDDQAVRVDGIDVVALDDVPDAFEKVAPCAPGFLESAQRVAEPDANEEADDPKEIPHVN